MSGPQQPATVLRELEEDDYQKGTEVIDRVLKLWHLLVSYSELLLKRRFHATAVPTNDRWGARRIELLETI
jgi:hypothetical protein